MGKKVTLQTIATKAQCSTATVSLVMRDNPKISQDTRDRVWQAIYELNYNLPSKKNNGKRVIIALGCGRDMFTEFYSKTISGIEKSAKDNGWDTVIYEFSREEQINEIIGMNCDGFIFGFVKYDFIQKIAKKLQKQFLVILGGNDPICDCDRVSYDNLMISQVASEELINQGHKRVALVSMHSGSSDANFLRERVVHAKSLLLASDCSVEEYSVLSDHKNSQEIVNEFETIAIDLKKKKITGIFCNYDLVTSLLQQRLVEIGIKPGIEMSIISCNNEWSILRTLSPKPVTIDVFPESIGYEAMERLIRRVATPSLPKINLMMKPVLIKDFEKRF